MRTAKSRPARAIAEALRTETIGGIIMLTATVAALAWANMSPDSYDALRETRLGPMQLYKWAQDGLLTIFFFVAGLEVKAELVHGELANVRKAALPIIASLSGMVVPAIVYLVVSWGEHDAARGWAIPMATDIAFALAVLAVTASAMPAALRAFLLTCAVVDDLGAITVIAVFYTSHVDVLMLLLGAALLAAYALLPHQKLTLVPLGVAAWYAVEASGVHATVAGVALGLLTRTTANAEAADHYFRPISAGLAVPVFAFLSAGVKLDGSSLGAILSDRVVLGVIAGLVLGKFVGVFGGAWLSVRLGLAKLSEELHWRDMAAVSLLAGIGFTVSLLIGDLAYGDDRQRAEAVTTGILAASVIASILAAVLLHVRVRKHRIALDDV
ncbi:Na+/H+ antiporter NhaA [Nonomuraea sp. NPDC049400]|uniref:Na+/H+ antiporter NhaA n=1 Tax=Nonomuraea sp. NPDC049400 TaxID=3364352 RepID=UPI0037B33C9D